MPTYLLTWNASRTELDWAHDQQACFSSTSMVAFRWACGNTRRILEGDRLFFLRQRLEPRGLIALGYVARSPYEDTHWDEAKDARGESALFVDAVWEYFAVDPIIPRARLDDPPLNTVHWNTQKSGISVPDHIADLLENEFRWRNRASFCVAAGRDARSPLV